MSKREDLIRMKKARRLAFDKQGGKCYWCSEPMIWKTQKNASEVWDHPRVCTGDHLVFESQGGKVTESNIVAACRDCNNKRHPIHEEWKWLNGLFRKLWLEHGMGPWKTYG